MIDPSADWGGDSSTNNYHGLLSGRFGPKRGFTTSRASTPNSYMSFALAIFIQDALEGPGSEVIRMNNGCVLVADPVTWEERT
jgi:hypothetical protein